MYIYYQTSPRSRWMKFSFCVFRHWDEVEVHKDAKREQGQYPAILTKLAWSIKDLSYDIPGLYVTLCFSFVFADFCYKMYWWNSSTHLFSLFSFLSTLLLFRKSFYFHAPAWNLAFSCSFEQLPRITNLIWDGTNFKLKNLFVVLHFRKGLAVWNGLSKSGFKTK